MIEIANNFCLPDKISEVKPLGSGHINGTFLLTLCGGEQFVLQEINTAVFPNPEGLMQNVCTVTEYLKENFGADKTLNFIKTKSGLPFFKAEDGRYYRVYRFVADSNCIDHPETPQEFAKCGYAFGEFQKMLSGFNAETLIETIPDFHNTPKRFEALKIAFEQDVCHRAEGVRELYEYYLSNRDFYSVLLSAHEKGDLPLRVCHNDTKCNNVLLHEKTGEPLCVIDLDTVMPGFSVTDFGDAIRFGANSCAEDEPNTDKIYLDMDYYKAYAKAFIKGTGGNLPQSEIDLMPEGALMMTLECGMRFLTDYLSGDTYFKIAYEDHNLVRSRAQATLAKSMQKNIDEMHKF